MDRIRFQSENCIFLTMKSIYYEQADRNHLDNNLKIDPVKRQMGISG
jgi:hypothetical protein